MKKLLIATLLTLTTLTFVGCGKETSEQPTIVVERIETVAPTSVEVEVEEPTIEKDEELTKELYNSLYEICRAFYVRRAYLNYERYVEFADDVDVHLAIAKEETALTQEYISVTSEFSYTDPWAMAIRYFDAQGNAATLNEKEAFDSFVGLWANYAELHDLNDMYAGVDGNIYFE